ncbi:MAG: thiamine diphosphokinase [Ruminiclostridium sp.]|nr:thiamine diphosphokinase [Ruminiclostridium sp.]
MKKCYIICGGPETFNNVAIDDDSYIICADSGYDKALSAGITPQLVIGDFDSIEAVPVGVKVIKAPTHKDDTDTMLAIKTAISDGYTDITLLSAFSGRMDHSIANLSALCYISEQGITGRIIGDSCSAYYLKNDKLTLSPEKNRYLSVFADTESAIVSIKGAEYEVENYTMRKSFPIGVSNEFTKTDCTITAHSGAVFVLTVKK